MNEQELKIFITPFGELIGKVVERNDSGYIVQDVLAIHKGQQPDGMVVRQLGPVSDSIVLNDKMGSELHIPLGFAITATPDSEVAKAYKQHFSEIIVPDSEIKV